ncbi:MAG: hypothetical protein R6X17_02695 [Candidatus Competibacteraceae bacterium]
MRDGTRLTAGRVDLEAARAHAKQQVALLPDAVRAITPADPAYPVTVSSKLSSLQQEMPKRFGPLESLYRVVFNRGLKNSPLIDRVLLWW